jgi:DNA-binding response OmpR family regulator
MELSRWPITSIRCPHCGGKLIEDPLIVGELVFENSKDIVEVSYKGIKLPFTKQQCGVLAAIVVAGGRIVTKEFIYESIFWNYNGDGPDQKLIDVILCRIRLLLKRFNVPIEIETVWGRGLRAVSVKEKANVP